MNKTDKIIITGAAGLVGQNLILLLQQQGYTNIVAIDKQRHNLAILKQLNPHILAVEADLAEATTTWRQHFSGANYVVMLHAQITGLHQQEFIRNNITATKQIIAQIKQHAIPYTIHISSSVVNSVANDDYTQTKKAQEDCVLASGIPCCVLRPTLMFGWFDPKHLGWLSRFMEKTPVFPIPGHGRYLRQPLYSWDFCRIIFSALQKKPLGKVYDIVGQEKITYIDMVRLIKKVKKLRTCIIKLPYPLFKGLLKLAALLTKHPPFTASQLTALTAGDLFHGVDVEKTFDLQPTSLEQAFTQTFSDPKYSHIVLKRS